MNVIRVNNKLISNQMVTYRKKKPYVNCPEDGWRPFDICRRCPKHEGLFFIGIGCIRGQRIERMDDFNLMDFVKRGFLKNLGINPDSEQGHRFLDIE